MKIRQQQQPKKRLVVDEQNLKVLLQGTTDCINKFSGAARVQNRNVQRNTLRPWVTTILLGAILLACLLQCHRSFRLGLSYPTTDDAITLIVSASTLSETSPLTPTASTDKTPLLATTATTRNNLQAVKLQQFDKETPGMEWLVPHLDILYRQNTSRSNSNSCDEKCLLNGAIPYYVYPEHMLFSDQRYYLSNLAGNDFNTDPLIKPTWHRGDITWEVDIMNTLLNHSLRTDSYEKAELFIIPVSLAAIFFDEPHRAQRDALFDDIRFNLQNSTAFSMGKPHVLLSMTFPLFNTHYNKLVGKAMTKLYKALPTVAIARSDDLIGTQYAYLNNVTPTKDFRGFEDPISSFASTTEYQFCVGLGGEALHLPLIVPTWEKFQNATFFIFYHIRRTPFYCNSTEFRRAPILNVSSDALPLSTIGYDIRPEQWKREFVDSKFCLVMRGDTPHSHALFNAIKVGCIPVVISDWYPLYAPPFPTTLDMREFCVFLPEGDFLSNPQKSLQSLQDIPDDVIQRKLRSLKWAQQVMMMDHPESLFVPAFVREAMSSLQRPASKVLRVERKS